jgi:hypothetical protein
MLQIGGVPGVLFEWQKRRFRSRMIDRDYLETVFGVLRRRPDVLERCDPGLTNSEVDAVQRKFGFTFPPDLRNVLQFALPVGKGFPNWRADAEEDLRSWMNGPLDGIWFDVEHAGFWLSDWCLEPKDGQSRYSLLKHAIEASPRLIPVFMHRYIPSEPNTVGNPVFSVHQTDIIFYGNDLADYFHREFGVPLPDWAAREPRHVRFWSDSVEWMNHEENYREEWKKRRRTGAGIDSS